ncbi:50S ribosomal protein L25 [Fastidiosibacter lacustris]|uniref:50S ribosomal protein L25 n=1 Tax=Fastidiosibacter lacustris TaxID=2056695 RepID=UPI000E343212|nr:50S ribosomal protein L25 [Fastidiosibacter lacustris]
MTEFTFQAELKTEKGTGASRRLRKADKIPAIIYGKGAEALLITLEHDKVLHAAKNKAFYDGIVTIHVDGKNENVKIQALQRHPFKPKILHADFIRV